MNDDALSLYAGKLSPRFYEVREKMQSFIMEVIVPRSSEYKAAVATSQAAAAARGAHPLSAPQPAMLADLRAEAKVRGLYNFFLPEVSQLTVLEYAPLAEMLGPFPLANLAMNCTAPDTGNMEVLERYGTAAQQRRWLDPLLAGEIRSCFAMTEPGVASSDATNISTTIERSVDGKTFTVNGHKWWISGAIRDECKVAIVMGKAVRRASSSSSSSSSEPPSRHSQHSMILVPMDAPGVTILNSLQVMGHDADHAELIFDNVVVPAGNIILGEGRGFEIAQGRLGPGRIHHCMRVIGIAELALAAMIYRANRRVAFGSLLREKDTIRGAIADARIEITKCRQLCYLAAAMADEKGFKAARMYIAMIKHAAPRMALKIVDEAIQVHGAHGVSQYSRLGDIWRGLRTLRLADGPDIVHLNTIAKVELARFTEDPLRSLMGSRVSGANPNIARWGKFKLAEMELDERRAKARL